MKDYFDFAYFPIVCKKPWWTHIGFSRGMMMVISFRSRVLFGQKYFALCQSKLIYKYQGSPDVYFEYITMSDLFYNLFFRKKLN